MEISGAGDNRSATRRCVQNSFSFWPKSFFTFPDDVKPRSLIFMENIATIDWNEIDQIIEKYDANREALLMIMQDISDLYNYVPPEVIPVLVEKLGVRKSLVYSVATFYKTISLEPRGKYIVNVCTGTACHVRGADKIMDALKEHLHIREGETTDDLMFTLEAVRCIGCCASGPVMTVNQETHGGLDRATAVKTIKGYNENVS
jgi:NADH-quinone oxidoreductase subunit E